MKIRNCYTRFILPCFFAGLLIFSIPALSFSAKPGLLCSDGVLTQTIDADDPFTVLAHGIKVVDYDGIDSDGDSHVVEVTYPNGSIYQLTFSYPIDEHSAHYSLWDDDIEQDDLDQYTGDYVYTVIDVPGDDDAVAIDYLDVQPVIPPNETSFSPGYGSPQRITAFFDNVQVNGSPYDNFENGFDPLKWEEQPEVVTFVDDGENVEACFDDEWGATESGDRSMDLLDPETVNKLEVDVRIDHIISGDHPVARIGGTYFNDGEGDIKAVVFISCDEARYVIYRNIENSDIREWVVPPTLLSDELTEGNTYTLSINWDGAAFTFGVSGNDIENKSDTFTPSGDINPTENDRHIDVYCWVTVDSTTPIFNWERDSTVTCYAVCIFNSEGQAIFCGDLKSPSYQLPPGVLKPGGEYFYVINAFKHHQWFEGDNFASSEWNQSWFHVEAEEEAQEPYIDLYAWKGVRTVSYWQDEEPPEELLSIVIGVNDAQGVPGNIASVKVIFPGGHTERPLYLLRNDGPYSGSYLLDYFGSMPEGDYTFVVKDRDGNTYQAPENFTKRVLPPIDPSDLTPVHNAVIPEIDDTVTFRWKPVSNAQMYALEIYDQHGHRMLTCRIDSEETQVILPVGLFEAGKTYSYRVKAYDAFFEDGYTSIANMDNTKRLHFKIAPVVHGTDSPTLDLANKGAYLAHVTQPDGSGTYYYLGFLVKVTDGDGVPNNIKNVTVEYLGKTTPLYYWYGDSDTEGYYRASEILDSVPPAGTYTFTFAVEDHAGNTDVLIDDITVAPLPIPRDITPESGAVVSLRPTFRWNQVPGAIKYKLRLYSGWDKELFESDPFSEPSYRVAEENVLEPEDIYQYRVYAFREDPDLGDIDNFSCNTFASGMMPHFFTSATTECVPDIKANGLDGPVGLTLGETLSLTIRLDPGDYPGVQADWWCVADAPFGWWYYDAGTKGWLPGFKVSYQGPLFELTPPSEVLNVSDLPLGCYTFYFGVDGNRNGNLDEPLYYDSVEVTITP